MLRAKRPEGEKNGEGEADSGSDLVPAIPLAPRPPSLAAPHLPGDSAAHPTTHAHSCLYLLQYSQFPRTPVPSIPGRYRQIRSSPRGARLPPARPCILLRSSSLPGLQAAGFIPLVGWGTAETGWASGCGDNRSAHPTLTRFGLWQQVSLECPRGTGCSPYLLLFLVLPAPSSPGCSGPQGTPSCQPCPGLSLPKPWDAGVYTVSLRIGHTQQADPTPAPLLLYPHVVSWMPTSWASWGAKLSPSEVLFLCEALNLEKELCPLSL